MTRDNVLIDYDTAVSRLADGDDVHTFRQGSIGMLLGADWSRNEILAAMKAAPEILEAGEIATNIGHGIAIKDDGGWLFIATKKPA